MDRTAELRDIVKTHGAVALAKVLVEDGSSHGISEHELTDAITAYAKAAHPGISPDSAFAKVFTALTDEGRTLRQAVALAKAAPFDPEPQVISGERARGGDVDVNDPRAAMEAYNTLMALAADYRRANPAVSEAQAKLGSDYSARATPKKQIICAPDAH